MSEPRLAHFERVVVRTTDGPNAEFVGQKGTVLGISTTDEGIAVQFAVSLDNLTELRMFGPNELATLGEFAPREDYFTGEGVRVVVDQNGVGRIVP